MRGPACASRSTPARSSIEPGVAGARREVVAHVDAGSLSPTDLSVQAVHGPVNADGSFDEDRMVVIDMAPAGDGRFTATFAPEQAGRWGVSVRVLPTHPLLTGPFDTGLVAIG